MFVPLFLILTNTKFVPLEDIRTCILFARKYNLRVTVRASGHSYVGRSTADGSLQINVAYMTNIRVIRLEATAVVESGNNWRRIYEEVKIRLNIKDIKSH